MTLCVYPLQVMKKVCSSLFYLKFFVQNSELMLEKWEILLVWEDWTKKYLCVLELIELEPFPPATCSVC